MLLPSSGSPHHPRWLYILSHHNLHSRHQEWRKWGGEQDRYLPGETAFFKPVFLEGAYNSLLYLFSQNLATSRSKGYWKYSQVNGHPAAQNTMGLCNREDGQSGSWKEPTPLSQALMLSSLLTHPQLLVFRICRLCC